MIQWRFPSNDHGENKGINDSGIAEFKGNPLSSLAREICQNSLDAANSDCITVEFNVFDICKEDMPGASELLDSFKKCLSFWGSQKAETTREFFEEAVKVMESNKISVLRISDFHTKGLLGSRAIINTDWTNLTKSSGSSDKKSTAGGSYGIGKFAPFACSYFSTVFYSTYDIEGFSASQGVSRLVTFTRDDGNNTQGIGYFGNDKNTPIYEQMHIDRNFKRGLEDFGTDIFVIGYKFIDNWKRQILITILDEFLSAICESKLAVKIDNEILNSHTLKDFIEKYKDELKGSTFYYYQVLKSENTMWFVENFLGLGEVKLGLLLGDQDYPKKICMIRKTGMKIMDRTAKSHASTVGIMQINGDMINEKLRMMENPKHTKWEPERAKNPNEARSLLNSISDFIQSKLEEVVSLGEHESVDASGVGNLLPDLELEDDGQITNEVVSDKILETEIKKIKLKNLFHTSDIKVKKRKSHTHETILEDVDGDEEKGLDLGSDSIHWEHDGERGSHVGVNPGEERQLGVGHNKKVKKINEINVEKFIAVCVDREKGTYVISLTPSTTANNGYIELYLSAETQNYNAPIVDVVGLNTEVSFENNIIKNLNFKSGEQIRLKVLLDYYNMCAMEVKVYAIEE